MNHYYAERKEFHTLLRVFSVSLNFTDLTTLPNRRKAKAIIQNPPRSSLIPSDSYHTNPYSMIWSRLQTWKGVKMMCRRRWLLVLALSLSLLFLPPPWVLLLLPIWCCTPSRTICKWMTYTSTVVIMYYKHSVQKWCFLGSVENRSEGLCLSCTLVDPPTDSLRFVFFFSQKIPMQTNGHGAKDETIKLYNMHDICVRDIILHSIIFMQPPQSNIEHAQTQNPTVTTTWHHKYETKNVCVWNGVLIGSVVNQWEGLHF